MRHLHPDMSFLVKKQVRDNVKSNDGSPDDKVGEGVYFGD
jgi:hypothetical protein